LLAKVLYLVMRPRKVLEEIPQQPQKSNKAYEATH